MRKFHSRAATQTEIELSHSLIYVYFTNFLNYLTCFDTQLNFNSIHSFICSFNCGRWQVDFHKSNFAIRMWNSLENFLIVQRVLLLLRLPHKCWGFCLACRRAHPQLLLLLPPLFLLLLQRTLKCKANKLQHSTHTRAEHQQQPHTDTHSVAHPQDICCKSCTFRSRSGCGSKSF